MPLKQKYIGLNLIPLAHIDTARLKSLAYPRAGFTLGEALVSIGLLAVLAVILIPFISNNTGQEKLLGVTKATAMELNRAFLTYSKNESISDDTTADDIVSNMPYVRIIMDNSTGVNLGNTRFGTWSRGCVAGTPCMLMQNGAIVMYESAATFGGTTNNHAIRFLMDPDGSGSLEGIEFLLFARGRVSTRSLSPNAILQPSTYFPGEVFDDPNYAEAWLDG